MKNPIMRALSRGDGLVSASWVSHGALSRAVGSGRLVRVLPGIYRAAEVEPSLHLRARALALYDPRAVVVGRAAVALSWYPGFRADILDAAREGDSVRARGFRWTRTPVPPHHVTRAGGLVVADPAHAIIDLLPETGGELIDRALRLRVTTLEDLRRTLDETPCRPGNPVRRRWLDDSRDRPWSEAERELHRIVRVLDLPWRYETNLRVETGTGAFFIDLALPELRLGFEVDGYAFHGDPDSFEEDRWRDAELSLVRWQINRFAARAIERQADRVGWTIERLAARRAALLGRRPLRGARRAG